MMRRESGQLGGGIENEKSPNECHN